MSCERYHDALTGLAAGGPAPPGVEAHLASCERCRGELTALRRVLATAEAEMGRIVGAEPSPLLAARIRQAVARSDSAAPRRVGWLWPAVAAAAILVLALAAWLARAPSPAPRVAVEDKPPVILRDGRQPGPEGSAVTVPSPSPPGSGVRRDSKVVSIAPRRSPKLAAPPAPDVLVPKGEAEALVRFAALVHRDRHAPASFLAIGRPSADLAEPAELAITALEIVPLDPAETPGT